MNNQDRLRIVVGIDFSPDSIAAAKWAVRWLKSRRLVLVHALVVPELHGVLADRYPLSAALLTNARAGARHRLQQVSRAIGAQSATIEIHEGIPAEVIAQTARTHSADLVIVGKHGEAGPHRGYTGRTADRLVRSTPAAVLVANGVLSSRPRRLIVPLTYSSITPTIIEWTRRLQAAADADVVGVHVIGSGVLTHVLSMSRIKTGEPPTSPEIDEIFREDRERWHNALVAAGIPAARVSTEVIFGEVCDSVLASVTRHDGDMIVMGSHAGPLRRLLLGSSATAVLRHAEIPVAIVVEPEESETKTTGAEFKISDELNAILTS